MKWASRLLSRFRFRKVRSRFLLAMILLSVPPLFLLGYISFNIAKDTLTLNNTQTNNDHLETSSEVADLLFRNILNLNRSIVLNDEIRNDLRDSEVNSSVQQNEMNATTSNRLQRVINSDSYDSRYVDSLCVLDLYYQTYCLRKSDDAGVYETPTKKQDIEGSNWYKEAVAAKGRVVFFSYNVLGDTSNTFSTVKLFRDSGDPKGRPIGLLIVNLSKSMFGSVFSGSNNNGMFMAVDSSQGALEVVYPEGNAIDLPRTAGSLSATVNKLRDQGYLVSEYRNQTTGWTLLHLIQKKELLKQSNRIGTATTLIASLIALVALLLSVIISGTITKPLIQIKKMMVDWNKGKREFDGKFSRDEVGTIGETFKRISSENEELAERLIHSELKEREAELRALQAQIKPHFLYNTLDSIYWMARLQKNQEAAQMALSLSESFKLSLNKGKETIPVYKELQHIEHYMTIQNIRYNNRFTYRADIDESIMGIEILKLIVQPLVENAIYHGLEPKVGEGKIEVSGRKDGDYLVFVVEDDGVGIEDMAVTRQGYGLANVRERIELYYGATSFFRITSDAGTGTKVEVGFKPYREEA
ncbi:cache domain-containing sensor histidine kinase [Cohnella lupini]|uniref:Two-component system sensor histidine kinase YesM n=1 Tax=Cohnella lupini TaxID=1294267 RepID=A0A3D9IST9_9BACL|nr:sensor histidine kinase [Cohnella lupini]RED64745.1 two-component system sensor histidine kinase YesM [Cohnella lupini]